jgi:hypothetical protein
MDDGFLFQDSSSLLKTDEIAMNREAFIFQDSSPLLKTDDTAMLLCCIPLSRTTRLFLKLTMLP